MIRSFQVLNSTPQKFIETITQALSGRDLGKIVSFNLSGNEVMIQFSKLGKSEVVFQVNAEGNNFTCQHKSEKIALTHRALRGDIESKLIKVLENSGAKVEQG